MVDETSTTEEKIVPVKKEEIGSSGTTIYSGIIEEEYLDTLSGVQAAQVYDKMRRSDYQVQMNISSVKNPICGGAYEIQPASTDQKDMDIAEFIRFLLFEDMTPKFTKFRGEAIVGMVVFGYVPFEMVDKIGKHPDHGTYIGIKKLGYRSPKTIESWNIADGELVSITQEAEGDLSFSGDIPAEYLIRFAINEEGDNYEGISMLRTSYGPYIRKKVALKVNAIGIEKYAVPTPIGTTPETQITTEELATFKATLERYTSHQSNYLIKPFGYDIDLFDAKYDPEKVDKTIDSEDRRMTKGFLANFLELIGGGSYALSSDLSDFFLMGLNAIADVFTGEINDVLIKRYVDLNFGPQAKYPKLVVSGIVDKPGSEYAIALSSLVTSGVVTPDEGLEQNTRKRFGAPVKDEVQGEDKEKKEDDSKAKKDDDSDDETEDLSDNVKTAIKTRIQKLSQKRNNE